jgi:poly(hydroxyalkanoate) depolymerase family esterase
MWIEDQISSDVGEQPYKLWIPASYQGEAQVPLLMLLHGCTQNPDDFAAGTQMNALANEHNFLVVYPEQTDKCNVLKCWNWFLPKHQARGAGEPAKLAGVVQHLRAAYRVDPARTFVAGMSAGAAMAVIMGATYPDLFAAIGVHSGLAYQVAKNMKTALKAQQSGGPDPQQQGLAAFRAMGEFKQRMRVIVFQGTADTRVWPINADNLMTQWAWTNALVEGVRDDALPAIRPVKTESLSIPGGHPYTREIFTDSSGAAIMEKWIIEGMEHAWSGGSTAGSYTDPKGPKASAAIWKFFSETS